MMVQGPANIKNVYTNFMVAVAEKLSEWGSTPK
jgi:predicted peroxiredoxin